jgi:hypothetical protein
MNFSKNSLDISKAGCARNPNLGSSKVIIDLLKEQFSIY